MDSNTAKSRCPPGLSTRVTHTRNGAPACRQNLDALQSLVDRPPTTRYGSRCTADMRGWLQCFHAISNWHCTALAYSRTSDATNTRLSRIFLFGLADENDTAVVLRECGVDLDRLRADLSDFVDKDLFPTDRPGGSKDYRAFPAGGAAGGNPGSVLRAHQGGGGGGHRCPGWRARQPCRLFPANCGV